MWKIIRIGILCIAALSAIGVVPVAEAQKASGAPFAPVPAQILTAKNLFISNRGGSYGYGLAEEGPNLAYNEFYVGLKNLGKYELLPAPQDADLIFEISYSAPAGASPANHPYGDPRICLAIRDPKTHTVLWTVYEHVELANRAATRRKNFDLAMTALLNDVKVLAAPIVPATTTPPAPAPAKKASGSVW